MARQHGSHVGLGFRSRRLSWAALLVVPFILSVLSPTLIGAVQRRKQFQCATLALSTGEVPAGTSAHRKTSMLGAGRCGSEDFSFFLPTPAARLAGSLSGHSFGDGIRHPARSAARSMEYLRVRIAEC